MLDKLRHRDLAVRRIVEHGTARLGGVWPDCQAAAEQRLLLECAAADRRCCEQYAEASLDCLPIAQNPTGQYRSEWSPRAGQLNKFAAHRAYPATPTDCRPNYWLRPSPRSETPQAHANYGVGTVPIRRDYGVVPMGVGPHGNHTGP